jgi:hypothetical protein
MGLVDHPFFNTRKSFIHRKPQVHSLYYHGYPLNSHRKPDLYIVLHFQYLHFLGIVTFCSQPLLYEFPYH